MNRLPLLKALPWCGLKQGFYKRQRLAFVNLWVICHIQPFGSYLDDALSLFMEKHLVPSALA
ncbi:hypothetical protein N9E24_01775 [Alphaproteobacteria bacterium]|nr:hypothetical protein [Alphaproteobacteria bacterium]